MNKFKVYKITCKINNKIYIGQTYETLESRLKRHFSCARSNIDTKFYRAIRKYGENNFIIELLDQCNSQQELDELEFYWINKLNTVEEGYNSKNSKSKCGGDTLSNHPELEKIKNKLSKSKREDLNPNATKIKALNLKTKQELIFNSIKTAQIYFNMERHDIISKRCSHKIASPWNDWVFAYLEEEYYYTLNKKNSKRVKVVDIKNNTEKEFASYSEAERFYSFPKGSIQKKLSTNPNGLYREQYKFFPL